VAVVGQFPVGFFTVVPDSRAPVENTISNDAGDDTLVIENRHAAPLSVRPIDRDTQTPLAGFFAFHLPPLCRTQLPWDASWDGLVQVMNVSSMSNSDTANHNPSSSKIFQSSTIRWMLHSGGGGFTQAPLYPIESLTFPIAQRRIVTQGAAHTLYYLGPAALPPPGTAVATAMWQSSNESPPDRPPRAPGNDARFARVMCSYVGGTCNQNDLRMLVHTYCGADSLDLAPTAVLPFSGGGVEGGANSYSQSPIIDVPGAVALEFDVDAGAAAVNANLMVTMWLALPNF
jgi:hypothetical protein